ncbi:sodium-coupled monocarboxylate transporter 2 isoform X2 [Cephus cinctus]|uniref:Sodium-coupled monocarboxylate transporter 2 isoform X2 n=1 Tax=Cephus cinctus TaxID=211228 RepID=A0AAJ7W4Y4_CEPCN|nr:sodium-coupled monocarboxylate transporter 2 isoform X2 [Cephus cinctus]
MAAVRTQLIIINANHISGISLLGVPVEVYQHGTQYSVCIITSITTCIVVGYFCLPVFYKLQLTSTFEYLELRFARPVRVLASTLYSIALITYIPLVVYVPALAFAQATTFDIHVVTPVICIVCIFYTTVGGLKAVVWTDTIQLIVTIGGLIAVLILGITAVGGFEKTWQAADEGGRLIFFNMDPSPFTRNTFWCMSIGALASWVSEYGVSQGSIQRFLAVPSIGDARKALVIMAVGNILIKMISMSTGLIMYSKYKDCDPITSKMISRSDQILPYYVIDVAGKIPGLPGLFLAGLVSAGLSTMSASLNTVTGTIYEDFIDPWMPESNDKEARAATIMKITVVILGILCMTMVFVVTQLGDIFQVSHSLGGITAGPLLGLFLLGLSVPWCTTKGAVVGGITSLSLMTWIIVGAQWNMFKGKFSYKTLPLSTEGCDQSLLVNSTVMASSYHPEEEDVFPLYRISFMHYTILGAFITILVGTLASFVLGPRDLKDVDPDHFAPLIRKFLPRKKYAEVPLDAVEKNKITEKDDIKDHQ